MGNDHHRQNIVHIQHSPCVGKKRPYLIFIIPTCTYQSNNDIHSVCYQTNTPPDYIRAHIILSQCSREKDESLSLLSAVSLYDNPLHLYYIKSLLSWTSSLPDPTWLLPPPLGDPRETQKASHLGPGEAVSELSPGGPVYQWILPRDSHYISKVQPDNCS